MANALRGEVALALGTYRLTLRPSFAALSEIEAETGLGIVALAQRLAAGEMRLRDLAVLISRAARAADPAGPDEQALGELLAQEGIAKALDAAARLLAVVLAGPEGLSATESQAGAGKGPAGPPPGG